MKWRKIEDKLPPCGVDVLVLKTYIHSEYGKKGYHPDASFWTKPVIQIDCIWSEGRWHQGGKATHWMPLPKIPED